MNFSLGKINFRVEKVKPVVKGLNLNDINEVNNNTVKYLRSLSFDELESRLSSVSLPDLSDVSAVKKTLDEHGIIVIPGFVPDEAMQHLQRIVDEIKARAASFIDSGAPASEDDRVLLQNGEAFLSGYHQLSNHKKAVVQVRRGQDDGMIDIFNVDKWFNEAGHILRPFFESSDVLNVFCFGAERVEAKNLNFYINGDIRKTRGFHVDSYGKQLKGFVYLTDVSSLDDGPYTYVKGSHIDSAFRRINQQISSVLPNKTESPVVPLGDVIPVLAPKGALVISDQGGVHRGFPQAEGHKRAIAVMNYT